MTPLRGRVPTLAALVLAAIVPAESRQVLEKTPTPCKAEYETAFVNSAAEAYVGGFPVDQNPPRLLLLLGGSGSGKGTFLKHIAKHGFPIKDFVRHGLDDYLELLPEWQQTKAHPSNVYKDGADACYGGGAIPIAKAAQNIILDKKMNAIYEETGKNLERIMTRVLPPFVEKGYAITIALVDNSPEIAKARAIDRFQQEGRYAPPDYIEGTFKGVFGNYLRLRQEVFVKEAIYCDNSCRGPGMDVKSAKPGECLRCWLDSATSGLGASSALLQGDPEYTDLETYKKFNKGAEL